jgi:hypothetical protein
MHAKASSARLDRTVLRVAGIGFKGKVSEGVPVNPDRDRNDSKKTSGI